METIEFLEALQSGDFPSIKHYSERDIRKLSRIRESVLRFVMEENQNRRAPTIRQIRSATSSSGSPINYLRSLNYLHDLNLIEVLKAFFVRSGAYWRAKEPFDSQYFLDLINGHKTRGSSGSWRKRLANANFSTSPRYYLAAVKMDDKPAYWPVLYSRFDRRI